MAESVRMILDTDLGDDVDDAFALAQAVLHPGIDLVGITACYGDTTFRARLIDGLLAALGATGIPVLVGPETRFTDGSAVETNWFSGEGFAPDATGDYGDAVDFLLETVMGSPGEITVCAVGPLTSVATAMDREPGFTKAMKLLVIMGGTIPPGEEDLDYNFYSDPGAAVRVVNSDASIRLGSVQVTRQARFEQAHRDRVLASGIELAELLMAMFDRYIERCERDWTPLYDPATLGTVYDESFVKMRRRALRAERYGKSVRLSEEGGEAEVIEELDGAGFIDHLTELLRTVR